MSNIDTIFSELNGSDKRPDYTKFAIAQLEGIDFLTVLDAENVGPEDILDNLTDVKDRKMDLDIITIEHEGRKTYFLVSSMAPTKPVMEAIKSLTERKDDILYERKPSQNFLNSILG